ncbi:MAG: 3'-5' exonuclease [Cyclobacteriaceae bacterium]|nr:MAG: 3'-5' exonuclease [Cyclobacteriaceae bacterium]
MTDQELANILFVDIETVTGSRNYQQLDDRLKQHWDRKAGFLNNPLELSTSELYVERAGIFAEFGQIVTIAVGYLAKSTDNIWGLRVKALADSDESKVLSDFKHLLETKFEVSTLQLCAHNGREFDFPYICRRMLIQGIPVPKILDVGNMKPWEIPIIDTMNLWKFGDRKNFTSLDLLAALFNIETSKGDINGSDVTRVYHEEDGLDRIAEYCKRDIVVTVQLFLKLKSLPTIEPEHITIL